jgi:hypothetical protein
MSRPAFLSALLGGAIVSVLAPAANAATFDAITTWVGTGANQSALVVDFNDAATPESLVWGYRWEGVAPTAQQMFFDVLRADPKLYAKVGANGMFGRPIFGVGYDADGDGFGITDGTAFDADENGDSVAEHVAIVSPGSSSSPGPTDGATATDLGDRYAEGWWSAGYWSHFASPGDPYAGGPAVWTEGWGLYSQTLADGSFAGLSFANGYASSAPDNPVPEPTALVAIAASAALGLRRRRA